MELPYKRFATWNDNEASRGTTGHNMWIQKKISTESTSTTTKNLHKNQFKGDKHGILCPYAIGGPGNQLFMFASVFGIAKSTNMNFVVGKNMFVNRVFNLTVKTINNDTFCSKLKNKIEKKSGTFESDLLKFNTSKNYRIGVYLQSYKYFYNFTSEIKKQFVFRKHIQTSVNKTMSTILQKFGVQSRSNATLVGVHIRRGDKLDFEDCNVATPEYLQKTVSYFQSKYKNVIFIVASNGMEWTKENMPVNITVEYINGSPEMDMATLASCDHVISTVGTFGWWCGWLAGGEVTYFKWPAKQGSAFAKRLTYDDFYYPGWIGF